MEHSLLTPRELKLPKQGIPYRLIHHLITGKRHCDGNLKKGFGRDAEVDQVNAMEDSLGELTPEQMDRRVAVDCCCIWRYDYPQRVRDICAVIGGSEHTALRLHYQVSTARRTEFFNYAQALRGWLDDKAPDDAMYQTPDAQETARKVYGMLGKKDHLKALLVERTFYGFSSRALNCSFWGNNVQEPETDLLPFNAYPLNRDWFDRMHTVERTIRREMGYDASDFLCDVGGSAEPACHFKFIRRVDILVSSIGCMSWRGNLPPKDGTVKGRRQITRRYLAALEQYWSGARGGSDPETAAVADELASLMGEPDDYKRWLAASLWKNIKNQTEYEAYPMRQWVEFVKIGEGYLQSLE